jgi:DNA-directed RNA polymerase specialized sigma24 family protein
LLILSSPKKITSTILSLDELVEDEAASNDILVEDSFNKTRVAEIREALHPDEWYLLKAIYIDGKTFAELSTELGIEYDTCRKRVHRAKKVARGLYGEENL